jgi:hypothetical protein
MRLLVLLVGGAILNVLDLVHHGHALENGAKSPTPLNFNLYS